MSGSVHFAVRQTGNKQAIVMVHGFSGNAYDTFGMLPAFLAGDPALSAWDIHCYGYPSKLSPDITGLWSSDPDLKVLSSQLAGSLSNGPLSGYDHFALVAHSMGGLIVQRAALDLGLDANSRGKISHILLFGTPSKGLRKAWLGWLFKQQARDMSAGGEFVTSLRAAWDKAFPAQIYPIEFRATAGVEDQFVPPESSVDPFPAANRWYVGGNHLQMVKPQKLDVDTAVFLRRLLASPVAAAAPPAPAAAVAVSPSPAGPSPADEHAAKVKELKSKKDALTEGELVELVLALELTGRQQEGIDLLEREPARSTELTGVLAGRLKRRWLADPEGRHEDGKRALALYRDAYERAERSPDHPQAFYNGINTAFMELAFDHDRYEARQIAGSVLEHCRKSPKDKWRLATEGEASLYLGDLEGALICYEGALHSGPDPRQIDSMRQQAVWAARLMNNEVAESKLAKVFDDGRP